MTSKAEMIEAVVLELGAALDYPRPMAKNIVDALRVMGALREAPDAARAEGFRAGVAAAGAVAKSYGEVAEKIAGPCSASATCFSVAETIFALAQSAARQEESRDAG